jgi:hypothetical protein
MSHRNRKAMHKASAARKQPRNSARITTHQGAKEYDEVTLMVIRGIVPGVHIVHPLGVDGEGDDDRLSRARALARLHSHPHCAVVRIETMATKYFQELVLGHAHEIHVMRSKVQHVGAEHACPFSTVIVVFKPGHKDRIENGLCQIYWERAA